MRGRSKPTPPERRLSQLDIRRVMSRNASLTSMPSPTPSWKDLDLAAQATPASQRRSPSGVPNVTSWLSIFQQVSSDTGRVGALSTFADVVRLLQQRKVTTSRPSRASGAGRQGDTSERESITLEKSEPVAFEVLTVADVTKQLPRDRHMSKPARRHPSWWVMRVTRVQTR
jgi:hypothetical protein